MNSTHESQDSNDIFSGNEYVWSLPAYLVRLFAEYRDLTIAAVVNGDEIGARFFGRATAHYYETAVRIYRVTP